MSEATTTAACLPSLVQLGVAVRAPLDSVGEDSVDQGDSSGISSVSALVMGREEIVVLGGCGTSSRRSRTSRCNFMLLELSAIDGSVVRGPWQVSQARVSRDGCRRGGRHLREAREDEYRRDTDVRDVFFG